MPLAVNHFRSMPDRTWQTPQAAEGPSLPVTESRFPLHTGPSPPQPIQGQVLKWFGFCLALKVRCPHSSQLRRRVSSIRGE
ncbi:hypothetical protein Anapl_07142 [Anas platyrhynchos]|uniref:Uncharacterized protein n=1 Tax=Anas platyrhynchos TaxID=8839 RepID=R0LG63_ANAPL|nr:hypothetical protein Anapl_07142 [Anas platyrhynchos]